MKNILFFSFTILISLLLLSSCASMKDVIKAKERGEGTAAIYNVTEDQAWEISMTVFRWEGSDAIEQHRSQNYMLTSSGMNMVSYGSVMGAWVEPVDANNTKVTVVTKRRVATNLATTLTEATFHKRFVQAVEIIKSGQPLPIVPPKM